MRKKKILFRIGSLREGGAERVLVNILNHLSPDEYDLSVLLNIKFGKYIDELPEYVNLKFINQKKQLTLLGKALNVLRLKYFDVFPKAIKRKLKEESFDIEIAFNQNGLFDILKSPFIQSKKIVWIHTDLEKAGLNTPKYIAALHKIDTIAVVSNGIKDSIAHISESLYSKTIVIYNPIEEHEILRLKDEKVELGFSNDFPIACSVGTLSPLKGHERLLKVQKELRKEGVNFNLIIIGEGSERGNLESKIKQWKLQDQVRLLGYKSNPYKFINFGDVFIHSSFYEGFGNVIIEAMIVKKPILVTKILSAHEILQNGRLGLTVENSEKGMMEGIKQLLKKEMQNKWIENLENTPFQFTLQNAMKKVNQLLND